MKKYEGQNRPWFAGALVCTLISSLFAVVLQFFKGGVLACSAWLALRERTAGTAAGLRRDIRSCGAAFDEVVDMAAGG